MMHIEILVEDSSGKALLDILVPKIINSDKNSWNIHGFKGIGHIPKNLSSATEAHDSSILGKLYPILLSHSKTHGIDAVVIVIDTDRRDCREFLAKLQRISDPIGAKLTVLFRLAIEEMEAWFLGDRPALLAAYPKVKKSILDDYIQDGVCGTWELLAKATHPSEKHPMLWTQAGSIKHEWARMIGPVLNVESNESPSFAKFRDGLRRLTNEGVIV